MIQGDISFGAKFMASLMSFKWKDQAYSDEIMEKASINAFLNDVFDVYASETNLHERELAFTKDHFSKATSVLLPETKIQCTSNLQQKLLPCPLVCLFLSILLQSSNISSAQ